MEGGLKRSLILHGIIGVLAIFGMPNLFKDEPEPVNMVTVELVPISSITNVPQEQEQQTPKEEPKKEESKEEKKAPPPPSPPKQEEPKPEPEKKLEPKKVEPLPDEKPKPTPPPKPEPKKAEEKPNKKTPELDFDSVLKTVEKIEKRQEKEEKKEAKDDDSAKAKAKSTSAFDPNQSISVSERDAIIQQISQCWTIPAGAKDAQNLQVMLHLSLEKDGTVRDVSIVDTLRYNSSDSFYRAAAESAMRAVRKCSPLKNLPPEKYDVWKEIDMNFDPKEMLY